jgi:hypothetical protein
MPTVVMGNPIVYRGPVGSCGQWRRWQGFSGARERYRVGDGRRRDTVVIRAQGPCLYSFSLVVLVDKGTASAAELFAGMKSHGRAIIAGQTTVAHYATAPILLLADR